MFGAAVRRKAIALSAVLVLAAAACAHDTAAPPAEPETTPAAPAPVAAPPPPPKPAIPPVEPSPYDFREVSRLIRDAIAANELPGAVVQIGAVKARVRLGHCAGVRNLASDQAAFRPTFLLAVPRVFEKLFNTASQRAASEGRGSLFDRSVTTAIAYSRALDRDRISPVLRAARPRKTAPATSSTAMLVRKSGQTSPARNTVWSDGIR